MKKVYEPSLKLESSSAEGLLVTFFIISILAGALWAAFQKNDNLESFKILESYIQNEQEVGTDFYKVLFLTYFIKFSMIWLLGFLGVTFPVVLMISGSYYFSYGFTTCHLIFLYGIRGILIGLILYGAQSAILSLLFIYGIKAGILFRKKAAPDGKKRYLEVEGLYVIGAAMIALVECGVLLKGRMMIEWLQGLL